MTLENYWNILAEKKVYSTELMFFDNGFLSVKTIHRPAVLYGKNGKVFIEGNFEQILCLDDGNIACLPYGKTAEWIITNGKNELVHKLSGICTVYPNGYHSYTLDGETFYSPYNIWQRISLGYGVTKIVTGPNGAFAYQQKIRRYTYWYLCQIKRGKLVKSEALSGVDDICFFANGSYVVYYPNNNIHVFNRFGQKIFACNRRQTFFGKVGRNHFCATNGKRYKGVYSAEDGKCVFKNNSVGIYWENGAYYISDESVVYLPKQGDFLKLPELYDCYVIGKTLFCFKYKDHTFVIDTNQSAEELRQKMINALHKSSKDDTCSAYLAQLLTLVY